MLSMLRCVDVLGRGGVLTMGHVGGRGESGWAPRAALAAWALQLAVAKDQAGTGAKSTRGGIASGGKRRDAVLGAAVEALLSDGAIAAAAAMGEAVTSGSDSETQTGAQMIAMEDRGVVGIGGSAKRRRRGSLSSEASGLTDGEEVLEAARSML